MWQESRGLKRLVFNTRIFKAEKIMRSVGVMMYERVKRKADDHDEAKEAKKKKLN